MADTETKPLISLENWTKWDKAEVSMDLDTMVGKACFAAVFKGGEKTQHNALAVVFPWGVKGGRLVSRLLTNFWEKDSDYEKDRKEFVRRLVALGMCYDLRAVCYDKWNMESVAQDAADYGIKMLALSLCATTYDPACKSFAESVEKSNIGHTGNQLLRDMVRRCRLRITSAGNMMPDEESSGGDIIGVKVMLLALAAPNAYHADLLAQRNRAREFERAVALVNSEEARKIFAYKKTRGTSEQR